MIFDFSFITEHGDEFGFWYDEKIGFYEVRKEVERKPLHNFNLNRMSLEELKNFSMFRRFKYALISDKVFYESEEVEDRSYPVIKMLGLFVMRQL